MDILSHVRSIKDFPEKGIIFRDISPIFFDPIIFKYTIDKMSQNIIQFKPDYLIGVDSRGFLLSSALSYATGIPMALIRKKGKLPPPTIREKYSLEYGEDFLEISSNLNLKNKGIVIVDDVLATGGTISACTSLINKLEAKILGISFLLVLKDIPKVNEITKYKISQLLEI